MNQFRLIAEKHLTEAWGGPVRLSDPETLQERAHVVRCMVSEAPGEAPTSVILKGPRLRDGQHYDPEAADPTAPAQDLFDDWAGLQFLSQVAEAELIAPRFYAGDRALGFFLMEDLGEGPSPADVLLGDEAATAETTLLEIMQRLGQLHAHTIGWRENYEQLRAQLGPYQVDPERYARLAANFRETLEKLAVPLRPSAAADLDRVSAALGDPGPFLAFTHNDPCPDNWRRAADGRLRLFDFERGQFQQALLDGVYGTFHFPTCWCVGRLPARLVAQMEATYRAELIRGCPAAAEEQLFRPAVVEACAFWMLKWATSEWRGLLKVLEDDITWGLATVRQRWLMRSDIFVQLTQTTGYLESLGATFADLAVYLRGRWPPEANDVLPYPAFR